MPLRNQLIPAEFVAGIDESKDPKLTSQSLLVLENGIFDRRGAISKREGTLQQAGADSNNLFLGAYENKPVEIGDTIQCFKTTDGDMYTGTFTEVADSSIIDIDTKGLIGESKKIVGQADIAEINQVYIIHTYEYDNATATYSSKLRTYDKYTKYLIDELDLGGAGVGFHVKPILGDNVVYCFTCKDVSGNLKPGYISVNTTGTIDATFYQCTGAANTTGVFDVCKVHDHDSFILIHVTSANAPEFCCWENASKGSGTWTTATPTGTTLVSVVGIFKLEDYVAVGLYDDASGGTLGVWAVAYDFRAGLHVTKAVVWTGVVGVDYVRQLAGIALSDTQTICYIDSDDNQAEKNSYIIHRNTYNDSSGTGVAGTPSILKIGPEIAGKPFMDSNSKIYIPSVVRGTVLQDSNNGYFLIRDDGKIAARALLGYSMNVLVIIPAEVVKGDGDNWLTCYTKLQDTDTSGNHITIGLVTMDISKETNYCLSNEAQEILAIGGANPQEYDGQNAIEQGFLRFPRDITTNVVNTGSPTSIGVGQYGYVAIYEYYDSKGNRHISAPSAVATATTTTANDRIDITIPYCTLTDKLNVIISLYRTTVIGNIYYRLPVTIANVTTTRDITYQDTYADSVIADEELLYTTGGALEHVPPTPYRVHCIHQQRQFYVNRENESWEIRYSKKFIPNEGIAHNDSLIIKCSQQGGAITGLKSFSDRLIIFKESHIFSTSGDGLNNLGSGINYQEPYLITDSIGCINPNTIVRTPQGLMFESQKGIYLLSQSLQVVYIGEQVQKTTSEKSIVSASLVMAKEYVIFLTTTSEALVYNYVKGVWSTFTNYAASDSTVADEILYFKRQVGGAIVASQYATTYKDNADYYSLRLITGWFSFAGLMGFKRLRETLILGQNLGNCSFRVLIGYDFKPAWQDALEISSSSYAQFDYEEHYKLVPTPTTSNYPMVLRVQGSRQKCMAVRFAIYDNVGTPEESYDITGISFLVAIKEGVGTDNQVMRESTIPT